MIKRYVEQIRTVAEHRRSSSTRTAVVLSIVLLASTRAWAADPVQDFYLCVAQYRQNPRMACAQQRQAYKEYHLRHEDAVSQAFQDDPAGTCQHLTAEALKIDRQYGRQKQEADYTQFYSDCMSLGLQRRQLMEDRAECGADAVEEELRIVQVPTQDRLNRLYAQCMIAKGHSDLFVDDKSAR
jgi:hypothetical protein